MIVDNNDNNSSDNNNMNVAMTTRKTKILQMNQMKMTIL